MAACRCFRIQFWDQIFKLHACNVAPARMLDQSCLDTRIAPRLWHGPCPCLPLAGDAALDLAFPMNGLAHTPWAVFPTVATIYNGRSPIGIPNHPVVEGLAVNAHW